MAFKVPNQYRLNSGLLGSTDEYGNNGFFIIPHDKVTDYEYRVQASDGMGWEHVSVSVGKGNEQPKRCPTWSEMCHIKNLFWGEDDCVIQYHPAKKEYVNLHHFVLHLWRPTEAIIPIPLKEMIG